MKVNGIEYGGQDENAISFNIDAGALKGDAVGLTGNGTAGRGADNDAFYGKVQIVEQDGVGAVKRDGIVVVPCVSAGLTAGYRNLAVNGAGKVKIASSGGRAAWVIAVDATNNLAAIDLG